MNCSVELVKLDPEVGVSSSKTLGAITDVDTVKRNRNRRLEALHHLFQYSSCESTILADQSCLNAKGATTGQNAAAADMYQVGRYLATIGSVETGCDTMFLLYLVKSYVNQFWLSSRWICRYR